VKVYIPVDMEGISGVAAGEHVDTNYWGMKPSPDAMRPHRHPPWMISTIRYSTKYFQEFKEDGIK